MDVRKEIKKRLTSFEQWCYRKMLQIGWRGLIAHEEVFQKAVKRNGVWKSMQHSRTRLMGHNFRIRVWTKTALERIVEGKSYKGRLRLQYVQQIFTVTWREKECREQYRVLDGRKPTYGLTTRGGGLYLR